MEKQKNGAEPIRVYKPSRATQIGLGFVIVFVVIHFSIMTRAGAEVGWIFLLFVPIYALILWILVLSSTQQHLAIYENGLEYRIGNHRIFSRWEDMRRFESRASGKSRILGIYTTNLEKRQGGSMIENFLLSGRHQADFIPLSMIPLPTRWDGCWSGMVVDSAKFAETEFGTQLLNYAPQLFEYGEEKAKN